MEQTMQFVLGALGGSLLIMVIYSYIEVLKMKKNLKEHESKIKSIWWDLDNAMNSVNERMNREWDDHSRMHGEVNREFDNRFEDLQRVMGSNNAEVHSRMDELNSYIDSRIDKTIDVLCARMDEKPVKKTRTKKEEMLKS